MRKYIALLMLGAIGFTGCTVDIEKEIANQNMINLEERNIDENSKRDKVFLEDNKDIIEFLKTLEIDKRNINIELDTTNNLLEIISYNNQESELKENKAQEALVQALENSLTPGIQKFITETKEYEGYRSTIINDTMITIESREPKENSNLIIRANMIKPINQQHIQILEAINKEGFMVMGPYIGENKEIIEISTPAYINENRGGNVYYTQDGTKKINNEENMSYQAYIQEGKINKIRMIINKPINSVIDNQYLMPLYDFARLMKIEDIDEIDRLVDLINSEESIHKKGTMKEYKYKLTSFKDSNYYGNDNDTNDIIEFILYK